MLGWENYPRAGEGSEQQLLDAYLKGQLDEIWLIRTVYVSIFAGKVVQEKFLNITFPEAAVTAPELDRIFEPSVEEILNDLAPRYCVAKMQATLDEAFAAELAARVCSLRAATKNADEMIERLTLFRNKVRQRDITREMIEIVSGAESLK